MSRLLRSAPLLLLLLLLAGSLAAGCGGGSDDGDDDGRSAKQAAEDRADDADDQAADDEEPTPTPVPEPVPDGELPPIVVTSPAEFETIVGRLVLRGTAQVSEGTLAWAILGADLKPMVQGTTTASCGAPCRGAFEVEASLAQVPLGSWELHVWSPNDSDEGPARLHDAMVPITISDQLVEGAPPAGSEPPGGAPRG